MISIAAVYECAPFSLLERRHGMPTCCVELPRYKSAMISTIFPDILKLKLGIFCRMHLNEDAHLSYWLQLLVVCHRTGCNPCIEVT